MIKGYGTDKGFEIATNAQQVYGGHGYIAEWGMEQYVRDARIAMIYEGANGVQAMDLVGRKLAHEWRPRDPGLLRGRRRGCRGGEGRSGDCRFRRAARKGEWRTAGATMWFMQNGMANPNNVGAGAHSYMHLMGIVALGLMWLRMARAAAALKSAGEGDAAFLDAKLVTARYFAERIMPDAGALRRKIEGGAEALMALPPESFMAA